MPTFYESENSPIASELVRQGFTLDQGEVLRIVDIGANGEFGQNRTLSLKPFLR